MLYGALELTAENSRHLQGVRSTGNRAGDRKLPDHADRLIWFAAAPEQKCSGAFCRGPYTGETPSGSYDFLLLRHTGVREHIVHGAVAHALERLVGAAADVEGRDEVIQMDERVITRRGLVHEHVARRGADLPRGEGDIEIVLVGRCRRARC